MNTTAFNQTVFNETLLNMATPQLRTIRTENLAVKVTKFLLYAIVFVLGIGGNSIVMWVMKKKKNARTFHNMLLSNLAAADLAFLLINLPFRLAYQENNYVWPFGNVLCKIIPSLTYVFLVASSLTLVAISYERHKTMSLLFVNNKTAGWGAKLVIAFIWLVACVLTSPLIIALEVVQKRNGKLVCTDSWPSRTLEQSYFVFLFLVQFLLPTVVMVVMYCKVGVILREAQCSSKRMSRSRISTRYRKSLRLIFAIVVVYIFLTLPYHITILLSTFGIKLNSLVKKFSVLFLTATGASHPMIYSALHQEFAHGFKAILRCSKKSRRDFLRLSVRIPGTTRQHLSSSESACPCRKSTFILSPSCQTLVQKVTAV